MIKDALARKMQEKGEGYRWSDLSRETKIPSQTLRQIGDGTTLDPGVHKIAKIAQALECSIDELIGVLPKAPPKEIDIQNLPLFLEIMTFIQKHLRHHTQTINSSNIVNAIVSIYSYSAPKNKIDIEFADWYIKNQLF